MYLPKNYCYYASALRRIVGSGDGAPRAKSAKSNFATPLPPCPSRILATYNIIYCTHVVRIAHSVIYTIPIAFVTHAASRYRHVT